MTGAQAPTKRGHCTVCGFHGALDRFGALRGHHQHRINRRGREYACADRCAGSGQPPEPLEP